MSRLIIYVAVMLCAFVAPFANAKNEKEEGKGSGDVVEVTLTNGTVEKGRITKYWTALLKKGFNKTFEMKTDDDRDLHLSSDDVKLIYFPLRDSVDKTVRYVSMPVAVPKLGNKSNIDKLISGVKAKSDHALLIWYMNWVDVKYGMKTRRELQPTFCIKFDNDTVAYPFYYNMNGGLNMQVMKHHLKQSRPELMEFIEGYFKKNKEAKKRINKDITVMLEVYDEYLKQSAEQ